LKYRPISEDDKLCRFNQDNPHFSAFDSHVVLAANELCREPLTHNDVKDNVRNAQKSGVIVVETA